MKLRFQSQPVCVAPSPIVLFTLACLITPGTHAASITWQGGTGTNWSTDANWIGGTAPQAGDTAVFSSAATVGLNGEDITVNALSSTSTVAITISGSGSLNLLSGALTASTGRLNMNSNLVLGGAGVWSGTDVRVAGVVSDGTQNYGIQWGGAGALRLSGANSFDGGVTLNSGSLYIQNNQALGTGSLFHAGGDVYVGTATISNVIVFAKSDTNAINWRADSSVAGFGFQTTFSGGISGNLNGAPLNIRGSAMTWIFSGGLSLINANSGGLSLNPEGVGSHTYIFNASPSILGAIPGRTLLGSTNTSGGGGSGNLLVSEAITYAGRFIDVNNGGGVETIGGIHSSGTVIYSMSGHVDAAIRLYDTTAGSVNFTTLNSGAETRFDAKINDSVASGAVAVKINADYQQVNATASLGLAAPIYATKQSLGTVNFANSTGNTYRGGTTVHAGRLLVNNTSNSGTGSGAVLVKSGAKLGGAGIIAPEGANGIVFESGAVLSPGNDAIGTLKINTAAITSGTVALNLNSGATVSLKLGNSGASDSVAVWSYSAGDVVFSNNVINFTTISGATIQAGAEYNLFSFWSDSGTTSVSSTGITNGLMIGTGLEGFADSYLRYGVNSIDLVVGAAIPEPSSYALFAAGIAGLVVLSRRRGWFRRMA